MYSFYRHNDITPTDEMINTNRDFLLEAVCLKGLELQELSVSIGYSKYYLETCIYDGRMPVEVLEFLSEVFSFDYEKALAKKKKKRK